MSNQPKHLGGVLFVDSADKAARFIWLCDAFNVPLLYLADVPGFMIGTKVERQGIIRAGAKMIAAVSEATVPKVCVVVRKAYGAGLYAMCGPAFEPDATIALRTASIAVMGPSAAVNAVYYNKIQEVPAGPERDAYVAKLREEYRADIDIMKLASELVIDAVVPGDRLRDEIAIRFCALRLEGGAAPEAQAPRSARLSYLQQIVRAFTSCTFDAVFAPAALHACVSVAWYSNANGDWPDAVSASQLPSTAMVASLLEHCMSPKMSSDALVHVDAPLTSHVHAEQANVKSSATSTRCAPTRRARLLSALLDARFEAARNIAGAELLLASRWDAARDARVLREGALVRDGIARARTARWRECRRLGVSAERIVRRVCSASRSTHGQNASRHTARGVVRDVALERADVTRRRFRDRAAAIAHTTMNGATFTEQTRPTLMKLPDQLGSFTR